MTGKEGRIIRDLSNGRTEWGDHLFISAAIREQTIVVTVFYEDEI